jgi:hypothetical protein
MPPEFALIERGTAAWLPLRIDAADSDRAASRDLRLAGRLRSGADPRTARDEIAAALARAGSACAAPEDFAGISVVQIAPPLARRLPRELQLAVLAVLALSAALAASGATLLSGGPAPARLSKAIALVGAAGVVAIPLGHFVLSAIEILVTRRPGLPELRVDASIAGGLAAATIVVFFRRTREDHGTGRVWHARAAVSAVALALLVASAITLRDARRRAPADLGFDDEGLWTLGIQLAAGANPETAERLTRSALRIDGIECASIASPGPLEGVLASVSVTADSPASVPVESCVRSIDDDYCRALGLLVRGSDRASQGALVNETLAARLWPEGEDPIGRTIRVLLDDWNRIPVVGVVVDVPQSASLFASEPEVLIGFDPGSFRHGPDPRRATLLVRASDPPRGTEISRELERALESEGGVALGSVRELGTSRERAQQRPRAELRLAGLGSLLGLSLAGLGVARNRR